MILDFVGKTAESSKTGQGIKRDLLRVT